MTMDDEFAGHVLPPFPVDPGTLDLLWIALHPDPEIQDRTSLYDFLDFVSQMGGSDTTAVAQEHGGITMMRDQCYSHHDVIMALIEEIRHLRGEQRP